MDIEVSKYPELRRLCWNLPADVVLDGPQALEVYERNWRFVDEGALDDVERQLIDELTHQFGNGVPLRAG